MQYSVCVCVCVYVCVCVCTCARERERENVNSSMVVPGTCSLTPLHCTTHCIFRLERNQEREQGVSNLEYLKNVVLKVYIMLRLFSSGVEISLSLLSSFSTLMVQKGLVLSLL